ncbi:hypothetical protein RF11_08065 [Thelohanellus kitauei]|uniref:Tc1-like transposase DDE domain-containing protein n=1 Tax=Thelohanellus kitauei TaxID=669202 RepID=A0A0C2J389_THEKT|nr:hypothetical protein RF11_08065 [Thelohanellus kitauei]
MGNVRLHKEYTITEFFNSCGFVICFLPRYIPSINAIKEVFPKWKWNVKRYKPDNQEELFRRTWDLLANITGTDCDGFMDTLLANVAQRFNARNSYAFPYDTFQPLWYLRVLFLPKVSQVWLN